MTGARHDTSLTPWTTLVAGAGAHTARKREGRRIHLHEMGHWCCSIVGTCLSHDDLMSMARKWKIDFDDDARPFDIHGFFVRKAGERGDISRTLEKMLDSRYSGPLRRVSRLRGSEELAGYWNNSVSDGFVAGAYWAVVSHRHVPREFRERVFGEVHMMSHIMGGTVRRIVGAAAEIQARLLHLERHKDRWSRKARAAIERRDERIAELEAALADARLAKENPHRQREPEAGTRRMAALLLKRERAVVAARTKTRELESELEAVKHRLRRARENRKDRLNQNVRSTFDPKKGLCGKAVLYLGGRSGNIGQMRRVAEEMEVILLHHDGGLDQSQRAIGDLVQKCDAVVCPINYINHQACLNAKRLCKRFNKPFVPIRSSGRGTFSRALGDLAIGFQRSGKVLGPEKTGAVA